MISLFLGVEKTTHSELLSYILLFSAVSDETVSARDGWITRAHTSLGCVNGAFRVSIGSLCAIRKGGHLLLRLSTVEAK